MSPRSLRYLALGDSYTFGEGVEEHERWSVQLAARLRKEDIPLAKPDIVAETGWTTAELDAGIDEVGPQGLYDFVSLLIGVNNQYRERALDEYRQQFRNLLSRAILFADGVASRVLVVSIPDWGVTPFAEGRDCAVIAYEIDAFNDVNRQETERAGAGYVDITALSRTQGEMVVRDGLHPDGGAYSAWTELALPVARAMFQLTGNSS